MAINSCFLVSVSAAVLSLPFPDPVEAPKAVPQAEPRPEAMQALVDQWKAQRDEITSVEFSFRRSNNVGGFTPLGADEVRDIFAQADLLEDQSGLAALVNALLEQPHWSSKPWTGGVFVQDGVRTAERNSHSTHVFDGSDTVIGDKANNKFMIGERPGPVLYRYTLDDFRFLPPPYIAEQIQSMRELPDGTAEIRFGGPGSAPFATAVVDTRNAIVREFRHRMGAGQRMRQVIQRDVVTSPSGAQFPLVRGDFQYAADGALERALIVVVATAETNQQVSDGVFAASAKAGARVQDFRFNPPDEFRTTAAVPDVKRYADEREALRRASGREATNLGSGLGDGHRLLWVILANVVGAACVAIGWRFLRKGRRGRVK